MRATTNSLPVRVRLPDEIRLALEEDRLVAFAGAGVSNPSPSNLPLCNGLAEQIIGKPIARGREDREPGHLAKAGTDVHSATAAIVYNSGDSTQTLEWPFHLGPAFAEAVELVIQIRRKEL